MGWPSCKGTGQQKAQQAVLNIYDAAYAAGVTLKSFHDTGQLKDDDYRASLLALRDTKQILKEFTDLLINMPVVDGTNQQIVGVFINRTGESLKKLAAVGALHLNPDKAREFNLIVAVGVEATLTIYAFVSAIKKPTTLPPLPTRTTEGANIQAWLAEVN